MPCQLGTGMKGLGELTLCYTRFNTIVSEKAVDALYFGRYLLIEWVFVFCCCFLIVSSLDSIFVYVVQGAILLPQHFSFEILSFVSLCLGFAVWFLSQILSRHIQTYLMRAAFSLDIAQDCHDCC